MPASWENHGSADVFQQTLSQASNEVAAQRWKCLQSLKRTMLEKVFRKEDDRKSTFSRLLKSWQSTAEQQWSFTWILKQPGGFQNCLRYESIARIPQSSLLYSGSSSVTVKTKAGGRDCGRAGTLLSQGLALAELSLGSGKWLRSLGPGHHPRTILRTQENQPQMQVKKVLCPDPIWG